MRSWTVDETVRELRRIRGVLDAAGNALWSVYLTRLAGSAIDEATERYCRLALDGGVTGTKRLGEIVPATAAVVGASDAAQLAAELTAMAGHAFAARIRTTCAEYPELFGPGDLTCLALLEVAAYWDPDGDPSAKGAPPAPPPGS